MPVRNSTQRARLAACWAWPLVSLDQGSWTLASCLSAVHRTWTDAGGPDRPKFFRRPITYEHYDAAWQSQGGKNFSPAPQRRRENRGMPPPTQNNNSRPSRKARGKFSAFRVSVELFATLATFKSNATGYFSSLLVWPMPLPYPSVMKKGKVQAPRRRRALRIMVNLMTAVLSFLACGRPAAPPPEHGSGNLTGVQRGIVRRLETWAEALVDLRIDCHAMGQAATKVESMEKQVQSFLELASAELPCEFGDGYGKFSKSHCRAFSSAVDVDGGYQHGFWTKAMRWWPSPSKSPASS